MRNWIRAHPAVTAVAAGIAIAGAIFVVVWFEPQQLFIDERVDEALPTAPPTTTTAPPATTTTTGPASEASTPQATTTTTTAPTTTTTVATEPVVLHQSELASPGKEGTGNVLVLELPDGSNVVRFEDLDVGNGPDLVVILSQAELTADRDAYHQAEFVNIGDLKGNQGNQNYEIPPDVELEDYRTVAIWCRRFNYTFNAATIS